MTPAQRIERRRQAETLRNEGKLSEAWDLLASDDLDAADLRMKNTIAVKMRAPALRFPVVVALAGRADSDAKTVASSAESALRSGDSVAAGQLVHAGLEHHGDDERLLGLAARIAVEVGEEAEDAVRRWLSAGGDAVEAGELMVQLGKFSEAQELWADAPIQRARLALWAGTPEQVEGDSFEARRIRAGAAVLRGEHAAALEVLDALVAEQPRDAESHVWRAESLLALERASEATSAADQAMMSSRSYPLCARILRWLAAAADAPHPGLLERALDPELLGHLEPLFGPEPDKSEETLRGALRAFGGNRSTALTTVTDDGLALFPRPVDIRDRARASNGILRVRGADAAMAYLDAMLEDADHPLLRTHRGELLLWLGRYEDAVVEFEAAIEAVTATRWAWIGLGAARMFLGDRAAANATWAEGLKHGAAGPTMFAYRAENLRVLGDLDGAADDLEQARKTAPRRLATHINQALVDHARGDSSAAALAAELRSLAADLVGEGEPHEQLEAALVRMRGNRSSSLVSWFDDHDRLRILPWKAPNLG